MTALTPNDIHDPYLASLLGSLGKSIHQAAALLDQGILDYLTGQTRRRQDANLVDILHRTQPGALDGRQGRRA